MLGANTLADARRLSENLRASQPPSYAGALNSVERLPLNVSSSALDSWVGLGTTDETERRRRMLESLLMGHERSASRPIGELVDNHHKPLVSFAQSEAVESGSQCNSRAVQMSIKLGLDYVLYNFPFAMLIISKFWVYWTCQCNAHR